MNVIVNGDYKGCYALMETVKKGTQRCDVSKTGFIVENDPYYWANDGKYFQTDFQAINERVKMADSEDAWNIPMGYTFIYPGASNMQNPYVQDVKEYFQKLEDMALDGDEDIFDYIDVDSWTSWQLARDLTGCGDGAGANHYYYMKSFDAKHPKKEKLYAGPLWDFDSDYDPEVQEFFSLSRDYWVSYFLWLDEIDEFHINYWTQWEKLSPTFYQDISAYLDEMEQENGEALQESYELYSARYDTNVLSFKEQKENYLKWFKIKTEYMDEQLEVEK